MEQAKRFCGVGVGAVMFGVPKLIESFQNQYGEYVSYFGLALIFASLLLGFRDYFRARNHPPKKTVEESVEQIITSQKKIEIHLEAQRKQKNREKIRRIASGQPD